MRIALWLRFVVLAVVGLLAAQPGHRPVLLTNLPVQPATAMLVAAWNYTPDASVSSVKEIARAVFRYDNAIRNNKWGWDEPFDFTRLRLAVEIGGREVSDREAVDRLIELPVIDIVNAYHWSLWHAAPPPDFCREGLERTRDLIAQLRLRLKAAGLSEYRLDRLNIVLDFENSGPNTPNPFADPEGKYKDQPPSVNTPHYASACYLIADAFRTCGWYQRDDAMMLNYATNHTDTARTFGKPPFWRPTPGHVPGSCSDGIFVSGYTSGGPSGCLHEDELMDVIARAPAPIWLALEDNNPGLTRILRAAKASGKVRLVLLWGEGEPQHPADTAIVGDKHRNAAKGGSRNWSREQDAAIADAVGMGK